MSSKKRCQELLETIDTVLSECGKDPRRLSPVRSPSRPPWPGPVWSLEGRAVGTNGHPQTDHRTY